MKELFLLKLGEIVLKGQNRRVFEDKLKTNTRRRMSKFGQFKVTITPDPANWRKAIIP